MDWVKSVSDTSRDPSLADMLRARLLDRKNQTIMTFLHRSGGMKATEITGHALLEAAEQQARIWRKSFGPGRYVLALAMPHGLGFVTAVLAGLLEGIIVSAMPPAKAGDPRLPHIVRDCGARAVITQTQSAAGLLRSLTDNDVVQCPIYDTEGTLLAASDVLPLDVSVAPSTVLLQYTSGSTHMPKGVEMSGANIIANAALVAQTWGLGRDAVVVNWMPHYHDMGLMGCLLYPILFGGSSVQLSPFDVIRKPLTWLQAVQDFKGTITGGPAFIYAECLKRIAPEDCAALDLSALKQAFCGAEPVPADLLPAFQDRFEAYGLPKGASFACYGMAENALFVAGAQPDHGVPHDHTLAPCRLTAQTRQCIGIMSDDGQLCRDGVEGEIWVHGPSCTGGYLNAPQETADRFVSKDGQKWLRTGDLGMIQGDDLFVTGRLKDMLIVHGRNVAATEIEWLAASMDERLNKLAAAAFAPDPSVPSDAALLIEVTEKARDFDGADTVRRAITRAVRGAFGVQLKDIRFLPRGTLEKTSSGKVRRRICARTYQQGEMHAGLGPKSTPETP